MPRIVLSHTCNLHYICNVITGAFQIHVADILARYTRKMSSQFNLIADHIIIRKTVSLLDIEDINH